MIVGAHKHTMWHAASAANRPPGALLISSGHRRSPVRGHSACAQARPSPPLSTPAKPNEQHQLPLTAFPYVRAPPSVLQGAHKMPGLMATSGWLLASALQMSVPAAGSLWLPVVFGSGLGAAFAALNRFSVRHAWRAPSAPLRVVITGGTKGLGRALAREFLIAGDHVMVASRSQTEADAAAAALARQARVPPSAISGIAVDVSATAGVNSLVAAANERLGGCDVWVNNAGASGSFKPFMDQPAEVLEQVVKTNLLGALLCTRAAASMMTDQSTGGHVFNVEGAGSDGRSSPNYAAYGATKAGIAQFCRTMTHEMLQDAAPVAVHAISPGMVLTELLLEGATLGNKRAFDVLCEQPETVAAFLVPRMRSAVARGASSGERIAYLTPVRALSLFLAAPLRFRRFFNAEGRPLFPSEEERVEGQHARRTQRLADRAASRTAELRLAYSLSLALAYFVFALDSVAKTHGN